ncbi:MAG: gluconate:H+ symporter [Bacteroidota bacterium]
MIDFQLLLYVGIGIALLLFLILRLKMQAFIALLISSIVVALLSGVSPTETIELVKKGMGDTLGFVAVVVGLGAMFGAILEHSGGAESLAKYLLKLFGEKRANWAMVITGFFVAIPVFFDVAFILLVPLVYALQRKTGHSLLHYAIPLLAGLAITHAFIPPTPGPVAVADIIKADLGLVILFGFIVGIPTAILTGPVFGRYIAGKIHIAAPDLIETNEEEIVEIPPPWMIFTIISIPIVLILLNTFTTSPLGRNLALPDLLLNLIQLLGHPFTALILANLIAWYFLGIKRNFTKKQLLDITTASLGPAGVIILLTGAGGVFKQVLITTGVGEMLANYFAEQNVSILFFGFFAAVLVRVLQGSSTVAMITAAGLTAPLIPEAYSGTSLALLVIAIASGASILSHVNDSGFWLVSKYLGLNEKETFRSWSVMTTVLSISSILFITLLSLFF